MEEYFKREGFNDGQFPIPEEKREMFMKSATGCDKRKLSKFSKRYFFHLAFFWKIILMHLLTYK
jgi:hypothetical protein